MIDVKQAVQIAKEKSLEMLGHTGNLEEIERDDYKGRDTWSITLSLPPAVREPSSFASAIDPWPQYKRFLIDVETGELVAMKLRELASR